MDITIYSRTHVCIDDGETIVRIEYDDAGDFVDAIEWKPDRAEEFARIAIKEYAS
ncbi:hypothetical protein [Spiribacter onubensis]|uniref:Phage protein n=1 Tax=Spiribacter onubensis TaxID=3122420 RepID=A0ABV3S6V3_9GAMM